MTEVIVRPGWEVRFTDAGNLEVKVMPSDNNQFPILDIRPMTYKQIFLIRRRMARGAGDMVPAKKATDPGGPA